MENPINKVEKPMYNINEGTSFSTYSILHIQNIHLMSRKVLQKDSPVIIKEDKIPKNPNTEYLQIDNQIHKDKIMISQTPPFPERLIKEKLPIYLPRFDVLDELKNVCVKIPLL